MVGLHSGGWALPTPRRSVQILNPSSDGWTLSTHLRQEKATGPTTPGPLFVGPPVGHAVGPPAQLVGLTTGLRPVPPAQWRSNFESQLGPPLGRITK